MSVRRVYVEKKTAYAVKANELKEEITGYLGIHTVTGVRVLIRYDMEALSDDVYGLALTSVFSEPPVDEVYEEVFPKKEEDVVFTVEYLPGQFDQRADSAEQCVKLLKEDEEPVIRSATTYVISGTLTEAQAAEIKSFCINPVDSREAEEQKPETLTAVFEPPADVKVFDGFKELAEEALKELYESLNLAMTFQDFYHIQNYYKNEEQRDPSMTEIRVLDTYWSDHCRHTTFQTELTDVTFRPGYYQKPMEDTYRQYLEDREAVLKGKNGRYVCLMDLALLAMKKLRMEGKVEDLEESDEINACSIVVPVLIDGEEEEWLVNFKNETHNHPTEIEPFGGAATCLGGAIRDPLSGRTYVYQAMRVTGAADPTRPLNETLKGKLPQRKIVTGAAGGYSSYGNQIGLATGYVKEIYHPDYVAKRMEIGAVLGAAPRKNVIRKTSDPGDRIILLGGRTGRDGCGGATGSSKVHTEASIETCGAEVQKGNAPTERKIQRLFRREEVSRIIKKCNDFGAGGVSVAIGELADGLRIDLDKVPKKYAGLDGTEIAISESQERMAVVVDPKDADRFLSYAAEENLEAVEVAVVTEEPRLVMSWRGKTIVDISRPFLDTNGAHQEASVIVEVPQREGGAFVRKEIPDVRETWLKLLSDLNVCSQKGLVEMFDSSIGAGSVFMPYGGKYQMTETQAMVAKLPVLHGKTDTVTMMSCGFDPYLSSWSPYHGAVYAVLSSVARIAAAGGDYRKIRFTFQEYFRRMTDDPARWSQPFSALLGAYSAQIGFGLPSIGGKDSMSGTFQDMDVPPTLVSFAVNVGDGRHIISPEFKKAGSRIVIFRIDKDAYDLPVYREVMKGYEALFEDICAGRILSAYAVEGHGICEAVSKMAFGNRMGVKIGTNVDPGDFFQAGWGNILCEVPEERLGELTVSCAVIGEVTDTGVFEYGSISIEIDEALKAWSKPLEDVFPTESGAERLAVPEMLYDTKDIYVCRNKVARPNVFIPVFPGTNCEYDSAKAFERAGANVVTKVFRNLTAQDIRESVEQYRREISKAQIVMFPGGFSAGDEPDGSAKFFANLFRSQGIKEEIGKLLQERDGLMLGICNGFQALIKLGLVPEGVIGPQRADSPTLAMNTIGRHISKMVYTKVVTNKSPWLSGAELGGIYCNPASHGEGRFVANEEWIRKLFENGQVATQYVDDKGCPTMDECWNPNGSYLAVEGITSPDGRILGKMAHSERRGETVAINIYGEQDMKIFESGVKYFQ
ncbi:phosphoribosylformylglycinamidine synthase [Lacrimispora saccharolytica]|uniref:Phosphoribosylformylglycinamidine synthase n=1 Tax=Lacrimispora saccharolytica (strain ATCC 35040 / DSM 2544 / NRCC 2533 / WM1) TaxID=610130 RepID=D9R8X6_LACSW|nr:phosphoribosylformylglycinamidine synthase [Lacrimispora saccharolytica]ADL03951.1 phosphoribosylformylglycinamidine synthase [[Clostridium] saccharolyticum WM1]QRV21741.1 phosphoribosylformylglycinamidine synthase [Lacrimispora saccharolytica]